MNVAGGVPPAPRAGGSVSNGATDLIVLGLTAFLLLWQIILMGVAGRILNRINNFYDGFYLGPFLG